MTHIDMIRGAEQSYRREHLTPKLDTADTQLPKDHVPRVVTVLNHVNSLNLGDASLLFMILRIIREAVSPDKVYVLSFDPEKDTSILGIINDDKVQLVPSPARTSKGDRLGIVVEMMSYLVWALVSRFTGKDVSTQRMKPTCNALRDADIVIVEGGDSLADTYGFPSLISHIYNIFLATILRKRMIILGSSIGPFTSRISKTILLSVLRKIDSIVVRDAASVSILQEGKIDSEKIHLIPDVAFDLPTEESGLQFPEDRINVGIVPSSLISRRTGARKYAAFMAHLCDVIENHYGGKIILIPHVLAEGNNDREIATQIHDMMKNRDSILIDHEDNPLKIKNIISNLDLLISPRMHPIIHALSSGVPVIAIDYNNKTREVMKLVDKEQWVISLKDMDRLQILVDEFFAQRKRDGTFYKIKKIEVASRYIEFLKQYKTEGHKVIAE